VRRLARIVLAYMFLSAIVSEILVSCHDDCPSDRSPASTKNAPLPPAAEHVTVIRIVGTVGQNGTRTRSFETRDSPAEVLAFYKDVLVKDGWEQVPPPSGFDGAFEWADGCRNHAAYEIYVSANPGPKTRVELQEWATGP
jgi:hypothetical protein